MKQEKRWKERVAVAVLAGAALVGVPGMVQADGSRGPNTLECPMSTCVFTHTVYNPATQRWEPVTWRVTCSNTRPRASAGTQYVSAGSCGSCTDPHDGKSYGCSGDMSGGPKE